MGLAIVARNVSAAAGALFAPWAWVYAQVRAFLPAVRSTDEMRMYTPPVSQWLDRLWPGSVLVGLTLLAVRHQRKAAANVDALLSMKFPYASAIAIGTAVALVIKEFQWTL